MVDPFSQAPFALCPKRLHVFVQGSVSEWIYKIVSRREGFGPVSERLYNTFRYRIFFFVVS